jgi:hypothetical protein
VQFLVQMGCFISEDVDEDGENSTKEARLVDLIKFESQGKSWLDVKMHIFPLTLHRLGCDADYVCRRLANCAMRWTVESSCHG